MRIQIEPQLGRLSQDNQVIAQNLLVWVTNAGNLPQDQGLSLKGCIQLPHNPISEGKYLLELFDTNAGRYELAEKIIIEEVDEKIVNGVVCPVVTFILSADL